MSAESVAANVYPWLSKTYQNLLPRIKEARLHHALLFMADKGIGEFMLIDIVAKALLCEHKNACTKCKSCLLIAAGSHPDLLNIVSDKPSIGVDAIRSVSEFVMTTSQLLGNKVVVIEGIEKMTTAASNALLKTLEEPNNNTYLILSTQQSDKLLATIKSRCEKIKLNLPKAAESIDWLQSQTDKKVDEDELRAYSYSAIDYLAALEGEQDSPYKHFKQDLLSLVQKHLSCVELADKWQKQASEVLAWTYQIHVDLTQSSLIATGDKRGDDGFSALSFRASYLDSSTRECQQASLSIDKAGINKSLLLQRVFYKLQESFVS